ncbi:hypothetical protein HZB93_03965, partial [Candidatus Falkowbacteria bacterium]|nr:hypothetical protein [Candidatus Falkowbacteria bacterium]
PMRDYINTLIYAGKIASEQSPQEIAHFAQKIGTNRLISEKIVSWDFAPPFDFTAQFLASRAVRRGERTLVSLRKKSGSPVWCSILELVRTHFAACGGEEVPPRKSGKAAPARRSLGAGGEPHR